MKRGIRSHKTQCLAEGIDGGAPLVAVFAQKTAELTAAALAVKEPEQMLDHRVEGGSRGQPVLQMGNEGFGYRQPIRDRVRIPEKHSVGFTEQGVGVLVGFPADHHPIDLLQVLLRFLQSLDASVDDDLQLREQRLDTVDMGIIERRNFPVLLGAEPLENRPCGRG